MNSSLKLLMNEAQPLLDEIRGQIKFGLKNDSHFLKSISNENEISANTYCDIFINNLKLLLRNEAFLITLIKSKKKQDEDIWVLKQSLIKDCELNEEERSTIISISLSPILHLLELYTSLRYELFQTERFLDISRSYVAELEQRELERGGGKEKNYLEQRMFKLAWLEYFIGGAKNIKGKGILYPKYEAVLLMFVNSKMLKSEKKRVRNNYRKFQERFNKRVKKHLNGNYNVNRQKRYFAIEKANNELNYFPQNEIKRILPAIDDTLPKKNIL